MPRYGGTLRYFGPGGMDHLDHSCAYYALSHQISRLFARQLFGYPTRVDDAGLIPAPDVAVRIPTPGNGLSADRRTYTIELRPGVYWGTDPPREVTAADFVRGFKRMCNSEWDITAPSWTPDWFSNNGRAYVPMFQSNSTAGTANYGCYENPEVD